MKRVSVLKRRRRPGEVASARVTIRNMCLECCGYNAAEVVRCTAPECWLWPWRQGAPKGYVRRRNPPNEGG